MDNISYEVMRRRLMTIRVIKRRSFSTWLYKLEERLEEPLSDPVEIAAHLETLRIKYDELRTADSHVFDFLLDTVHDVDIITLETMECDQYLMKFNHAKCLVKKTLADRRRGNSLMKLGETIVDESYFQDTISDSDSWLEESSGEDVEAVLHAVLKGFVDSLKGTVVILFLDKNINEKAERGSPSRNIEALNRLRRVSDNPLTKKDRKPSPPREKKVLKRTLQCCGLNGGVFWLSILLFEWGLIPLVKYSLLWTFGRESNMGYNMGNLLESCLSFVFSTIWVLPLLCLSKVVNSLWFQDIADSVYRHSRGRPTLLSSIGKLIADTMFSVLIQFLFLIQTLIVSFFPVAPFGYIFYLVHTCMLYSLYSFEYKMYNMGWELHKRLSFIETNWPYFIGFGLPLAVLTSLTSSYIVSGCIFSILFPFFIISANEANPVTNATTSQLQLFSPVIALSNALFHRTFTPYVTDGKPKRYEQ